MNYKILVFILFVLVFVSPVFAGGNLTVTLGPLTASSYVNTNTTNAVMNITFNATIGEVNITGLLINLTGTAFNGTTAANITDLFVYNDSDTDGAIGSSDVILGSNTTFNLTDNFTYVYFTSNYTVTTGTESNILIALNVSSEATSRLTFGINITRNESILTFNSVAGDGLDNITVPVTLNSTPSQIQDVHATAVISPRFVDTSVENQTFIYNLTPTGKDRFNATQITIPVGYTIVNVSYIRHGDTILRNTTWTNTSLINATFTNNIIAFGNFSAGFNESITINFTVNTNASTIAELQFNSTISGSNLTDVATTYTGTNINVTTLPLANVTTVDVIKSTAIINGTDYWEFNFTINITANVSGLLQFRMSEWNNSEGNTMNLTNQTSETNAQFYATMRNESSFDTSNKFNVTLTYGSMIKGLSMTYTGAVKKYTLRMIIPTGTPVSSTWRATYYTLFRAYA